MTVSRRKEVEQRACLVPWPDADRENDVKYYDIGVTADGVRAEANRFGEEIIDILWIKSLLMCIADKLKRDEDLFDGHSCETCGVVSKHALLKCLEGSDA
jgi:hypothetical protein